jgi:anaerobic ribonucleoside-triphosphate reductase activating protein
MTALRVHQFFPGVCPLLGPALLVWVQGCPRRCPGCFNQATLDENGPARRMTPGELAAESDLCGGALVLSGGEPFSQAEGLSETCRLIRAARPDVRILVYSGYYLEELRQAKRGDWDALLGQVDVLVDGPYEFERATDLPLAGSDNQSVCLLSGRVTVDELQELDQAHVQVSFALGQLRIVGAGSGAMDMHGLMKRLRAQGVVIEK